MDASETGVGAILSQRFGVKPKLHPIAFMLKKLNYDVGNRELLAVKLALEKWHHWLEGERHPLMIYTDHKNLKYIKTAKRINARQARWALLFTKINFLLSYCPAAKNGKADALSRNHVVSDRRLQFTSGVWRNFMEKLGVMVSLTSGYHPQANRQVERANQEISRMLRT